jgi:CRISPR-associated endoribonuclease Cas6
MDLVYPMPSEHLLSALADWPVLTLRVKHEAACGEVGPGFTGPACHGHFGACLNAVAPAAFTALFDPNEAQRAWTLQPPLETGPGPLQWGVRLFGPATVHAQACLDAFDLMGTSPWRQGVAAHPVAAVEVQPIAWPDWGRRREGHGLRLGLLTPLAIRQGSTDCRTAPGLDVMVRRVLARLSALLPNDLPGGLFAPGEHQRLLLAAARNPLHDHALEHIRVHRWSGRQQRSMVWSGLQGHLCYGPGADAWLPWFELAQALQLGGRTSFGFGMVSARLEPSDPAI